MTAAAGAGAGRCCHLLFAYTGRRWCANMHPPPTTRHPPPASLHLPISTSHAAHPPPTTCAHCRPVWQWGNWGDGDSGPWGGGAGGISHCNGLAPSRKWQISPSGVASLPACLCVTPAKAKTPAKTGAHVGRSGLGSAGLGGSREGRLSMWQISLGVASRGPCHVGHRGLGSAGWEVGSAAHAQLTVWATAARTAPPLPAVSTFRALHERAGVSRHVEILPPSPRCRCRCRCMQPPSNNSFCSEAPDAGPCRASITRWYVQPSNGTCSTFLWVSGG